MKFHWIAAALCTAACTSWAQTYTWTDITPAFAGASDKGHAQVLDVGIHPLDENRLIVTGGFWPQGQSTGQQYGVMYSDDGGRSWNLSASPALPPYVGGMFLHPGLPGVVYLAQGSTFGGFMAGPAREGHLYRSMDLGRTWSVIRTIAIGESISPFAADPLDAHGSYAFYEELFRDARYIGFPVSSRNPGLMRTHNDGDTWSAPLASPAGYFLEGPTPSAPTRLFMATLDNSGTLVSADSGASWSRADLGYSHALQWIIPDPLHANVLYGHFREAGRFLLLRSDDGGVSWRQIFFSPSTPPNLSIDPARPNVLWMPYRTDNILRSEDRGETWHEVAYPFQDLPPNYDPGARLVPSPTESGVVYLVRYGRLYRGAPASLPDPVVVEYNYESDRYWLTSLDGEAVSQDYRQQPGNVHRTGLRWGAWRAGDAPSGAAGSCRFWSRPQSGLRTRVLVLQGFECEALKRDPNWILEGENEFYALAPANGTCGNGLVPVRRFNNLKADLNHRWAADDATAAEMRARGWYDEGVRFCARPLGPNE